MSADLWSLSHLLDSIAWRIESLCSPDATVYQVADEPMKCITSADLDALQHDGDTSLLNTQSFVLELERHDPPGGRQMMLVEVRHKISIPADLESQLDEAKQMAREIGEPARGTIAIVDHVQTTLDNGCVEAEVAYLVSQSVDAARPLVLDAMRECQRDCYTRLRSHASELRERHELGVRPQPETSIETLSPWTDEEEARNKWIYEECCKCTDYATIMRRLGKKKKSWTRIDTPQGIAHIAKRYAEVRGVPPHPKRKAGRPKKVRNKLK